MSAPPAPRPQNLASPVLSDILVPEYADPPVYTTFDNPVPNNENFEPATELDDADSSNGSSTSDPFLGIPRVASPFPPGFYDLNDYPFLTPPQINTLLNRRSDPTDFNPHVFGSEEYLHLYQAFASEFVDYCNECPPPNDSARAQRVQAFESLNRQYLSVDRRVCSQAVSSFFLFYIYCMIILD
jgi:hypothetical protein